MADPIVQRQRSGTIDVRSYIRPDALRYECSRCRNQMGRHDNRPTSCTFCGGRHFISGR